MENIRNKAKLFLDKYLLLLIIFFALLTLLPYVSFCKILQVGNTAGIIYRGILLGIIGSLFVIIILTYQSKIHIAIWICTFIYILSQLLTIFISPIIKNVDIPPLLTLMGIAQTLITALSVICYLSIKEDCEFNSKIINVTCIFMISLGVFLCVYSYIFQYEAIYNTFNKEYGWNYDVTSIFTMKTEYGFTLFVCSIFSIFYILRNKKYWMYVFPVFFLINMFISRSKTSILCTTIILITLLIVHVIQTWNKYKKYWIITFVVSAIILASLIVLLALKIGWFSNLSYYISQVIFHDAYVVLADRFHKWVLLLQAVNSPFNIILGYGERVTPLILSDCGCATIGDNMYFSNYGVGGVIKFVSYISLAIYVVIQTWKINRITKVKMITLFIQCSFLIGALFEDDSIIGVTISGLLSTFVFYSCDKVSNIGN